MDIASAKIERRIAVPDSQFLNGLAVDPSNGDVYVSDMMTNQILRYSQGGEMEVFVEPVPGRDDGASTWLDDVQQHRRAKRPAVSSLRLATGERDVTAIGVPSGNQTLTKNWSRRPPGPLQRPDWSQGTASSQIQW